MYQIY